mmetsp:Transcript_18976/g.56881  ORF Transcript_18976/g.56881 Transcript_18976/m.56881 type:complete len:376 (-) Transcript_18976:30-1157(-)
MGAPNPDAATPFQRGGLYNAFLAPPAGSQGVVGSSLQQQSLAVGGPPPGALGTQRGGGWPHSPGGGLAAPPLQSRNSTAEQNQFLSRLVRGDPSLRQQPISPQAPQRYLSGGRGAGGAPPTSPGSVGPLGLHNKGGDQWPNMFARGPLIAPPAFGAAPAHDPAIRSLFDTAASTPPPGVLSAPLDAATLEASTAAADALKRESESLLARPVTTTEASDAASAGSAQDDSSAAARQARADAAAAAELAVKREEAAAEQARQAAAEEEAKQLKEAAEAEAALANRPPRATAAHVHYEHGLAHGIELPTDQDPLLPHLRQYVYTLTSSGTPGSMPRLDAALDVSTLEMQLAEMHTQTQSFENQMRKMHETCRPFTSTR